MAEVEPEVVETVETTVEPTVEPEPEPEPEKKKRKKRDDAPVRAPRVRRVAPKPSVVREELPPAPTEVDANFCCATRTQPTSTRKGISTAPPLCPRDCIKNCAI